jgi:uncharacterized protein YraI
MHLAKKLAIASVATAVMALSAGSALASYAAGSVNVRTGPGANYSRVDTLYPGEVVGVEGCQYGWCYITHNGADGWVSANFLSMNDAPRVVRPFPPRPPSVGFQFGFGSGGSNFGFSFGNPGPAPWPMPYPHHHHHYNNYDNW